MNTERNRWDSLGIFLLGLIFFLIAQDDHDFSRFIPQVPALAREMFAHGLSIFPTLYGEAIYPNMPAGQSILIYFFSLPFGQVTFYSILLPNAIAGALTLSLTYAIGATHSRAWGLYAVLMTLYTIGFVLLTHQVSIDIFITALTTLSFYVVHTAHLYRHFLRLWVLPLIYLLGLLFSGPSGLIIPAAVVASYYLVQLRLKALIVVTLLALFMLAAGVAGLLHMAYLQGGESFVQTVIAAENIALSYEGRYKPFYYYFIEGLGIYAVSFPLAIIVIIGKLHYLTKNRDNYDIAMLRTVVAWALIVLLGMSIPGTKKISYILPAIPALSLIAAYLFIDRSSSTLLRYTRYLFLKLALFLPAIAILLIAILINIDTLPPETLPTNLLSISLLLLLLLIAALVLQHRDRFYQQRQIIQLGTGITTVLIALLFVVEPIDITLNTSKPFAQEFTHQYQEKALPIYFYKIRPGRQDLKLLIEMPYSIQAEVKPRAFLNTANELKAIRQSAYIVMSLEDYNDLPTTTQQRLTILQTGHIGRQPSIMAQHKPSFFK